MRLELAGPRTMAELFQRLKNENPGDGCGACGADRRETLRAAVNEQHAAQPVPEPAVSQARCQDHPEANPAGGAPAVHPPHNAVVTSFDDAPEGACDSHRVTSH